MLLYDDLGGVPAKRTVLIVHPPADDPPATDAPTETALRDAPSEMTRVPLGSVLRPPGDNLGADRGARVSAVGAHAVAAGPRPITPITIEEPVN